MGADKGFEARIDAQNAAGGVDGKKLAVTIEDDTSTPAGNEVAAQFLLTKHPLVIGEWDAAMATSYRLLTSANVPLVGASFAASEAFGDPKNTNMFPIWGPLDPKFSPYTSTGEFFKSEGVTKLAAIGYGNDPTSALQVRAVQASANAAGVSTCYTNSSIPLGSVDFTAVVLALKSAGCDGIYAPITVASALALATAVKQADVSMKAILLTQGYSQTTLDSPSAIQTDQGVDFLSWFTPIDRPNAGVNQMLAQLQQYAGFKGGIPSFGMWGGWATADTIIAGLEAAGSNPTRITFEQAMRGLTTFSAHGVYGGPANFSLSMIGQGDALNNGDSCFWVEKLAGNAFHATSPKPFCGTKVS